MDGGHLAPLSQQIQFWGMRGMLGGASLPPFTVICVNTTDLGSVDLEFKGLRPRVEDLPFGILSSKFH